MGQTGCLTIRNQTSFSSGNFVVPRPSVGGSKWWGRLVSLHHQEVTDRQHVTVSFLPGTVDCGQCGTRVSPLPPPLLPVRGAVDISHFVHREPDCSAVLVWALVSSPHIILNQFIHTTQAEAKKKRQGTLKKRIRKDADSDWKWKEFAFTSKGVHPQACVAPLLCVGSLRMHMYMKSYRHTNTSFVSIPWRPPHWSFYRLYRRSVLLKCGEVACK